MCGLVCDTIQGTFCLHFTEITSILYISRHFCATFSYRKNYYGLYWAARKMGQFQAPMPKARNIKSRKDQCQPLAVSPPQDVYLDQRQERHILVIQSDSSSLTPTSANHPKSKEILIPPARQENTMNITSTADTLISQVTPLLGITPHESTQLQCTNTAEDVEEILGTRAFQRYVDTPMQTLDGIVVNKPRRFLPLTQEANKIAEEIRIEKINEQWAGIP